MYIPSPDRTERFFHRFFGFFLVCLFFLVFAFCLFPSCGISFATCQVGFKALLKARYPVKMVAEKKFYLSATKQSTFGTLQFV